MIKAYEKEALNIQDDEFLDAKVLDKVSRIIMDDCWVLCKDTVPVSICTFNARVDTIVQLEPV